MRAPFAVGGLIALMATLAPHFASAAESVWPSVEGQQKPWTRWWWPGSAVDEENLTRQLEQIAAAGFGGVEVTPIYGIVGAEEREVEFLSPRYLELLEHAAAEAKRLGMQLDMATGTGWPFGGPWVKPEQADAKVVREGDRLVWQPTGMKVKRAAPGGAGLVVNPFSTEALTEYVATFDSAFKQFPRELIRAQFHDSFEYAGNWTQQLPKRFRQMHGYELGDRAAELFGLGDPERVAQVRHDYRATLAELHLDYDRAWVEWCHRNGWLARNQAHGAPGNLLDLYAISDVPETETFGSTPFPIPGFRRDPRDVGKDQPQMLMTRFASSAAHVTGKPLVSSETFTWLREHFRAAPSMMKPELDQIFLAGVNHVVYHGTCYSPADAAWPGWLFYASVAFQPTHPTWRDLPAMNSYVARVQSVLQSGRPDSDVLLYWPIHDLWMRPEGMELRLTMHRTKELEESPFGKLARELIGRGYAVDFISDRQLADVRHEKDALLTSGGRRYRALVVPPAQHVPPRTVEKLNALAGGGATVIRTDDEADVPAELARHKIRRESIADRGVGFIRRVADDDTIVYFLANLTAKTVDDWVVLATAGEAIAVLEPLTGAAGMAATRQNAVYLQLQPGESLILKTGASQQLPPWPYLGAHGAEASVDGTWHVTFIDGGPVLPPPLELDRLVSWTDAAGNEHQRFAGTARYRIEFDAPDARADDWILSLGDVRESARVTLNGEDVGTLWSVPFRTRVGRSLRPGEKNVLEIEVTNLPANRIRDLDRRGVTWQIMKEINFVNIHYKPFDSSGWPLTASGLLGPVTLTPMRVKTSAAHE